MRIMVTGGTGFVGRHLLRELRRQEFDVLLYARRSSDIREAEQLGCAVFIGDLRDFSAVQAAVGQSEGIIHVGEIGFSVPNAQRLNVELVEQMLAAAQNNPRFRRFVSVSSITVVSPPARSPANEDTPAAQVISDAYTTYKREGEQALLAGGLPSTIVRGSTIYGPGAHYLLWLARWLRRCGRLGLPFPGRLDVKLPSIYVTDLARILAASVRQEGEARIYNAVDDAGYTPRDAVRQLAELLNAPMKLRQPPLCLQRALVAMADGIGRLLGKPPNADSVFQYLLHDGVFSNERFKSELGVALEFASMREGLPSTASWIRRMW